MAADSGCTSNVEGTSVPNGALASSNEHGSDDALEVTSQENVEIGTSGIADTSKASLHSATVCSKFLSDVDASSTTPTDDAAEAAQEDNPTPKGPYFCEYCEESFDNKFEAYSHHKDNGILHKFIRAVQPSLGDHIYIALYKMRMSDLKMPESEDSESLLRSAKQMAADMISLPEHHGIYIGLDSCDEPVAGSSNGADRSAGHVVSFDGCDRGFLLAGNSQVSLATLEDFSGGRPVYLQLHENPLPPKEIVQRAYWVLGKRGYNIQKFNCEHLATWCCLGEVHASQEWYSGLYADPVFPFGWAAAVAKDIGSNALELQGEDKDLCLCGRRLWVQSASVNPTIAMQSSSSPEQATGADASDANQILNSSTGVVCAAGHVLCADCVATRRAFSCSAQSKVQSSAVVPLMRSLCCARMACWEPLVGVVKVPEVFAMDDNDSKVPEVFAMDDNDTCVLDGRGKAPPIANDDAMAVKDIPVAPSSNVWRRRLRPTRTNDDTCRRWCVAAKVVRSSVRAELSKNLPNDPDRPSVHFDATSKNLPTEAARTSGRLDASDDARPRSSTSGQIDGAPKNTLSTTTQWSRLAQTFQQSRVRARSVPARNAGGRHPVTQPSTRAVDDFSFGGYARPDFAKEKVRTAREASEFL